MTSKQDTPIRPFLYVAVAGILILLLYIVVQVNGSSGPGTHVFVSSEQQQRIAANFKNTWQREPDDAEMSELIAAFVRQEIAWREATSLLLGRDDPDIRRRLQQHLESAAADEAASATASREELQAFLDGHPDEFRVDPLLTFRQIHFDNTDNAIGADASARYLLGRLQNQDMPDNISTLGDPSPLPTYIDDVRGPDLSPLFGHAFSAELSAAPVGEWVGPISSRLGLHIVHIEKRSAGRIPELDEIEDDVHEKWQEARRSAVVEKMYQRLADQYQVTIE